MTRSLTTEIRRRITVILLRQEDKPEVLSRSSIEAYAFTSIGIILAVIPMTWWLRCGGLLFLLLILADFIWRSPYTHQWKIALRLAGCLFAVLAMGYIGFWVYRSDHPKSVLRFSALATNTTALDGPYGIEWKDGYHDERLSLENNSQSALENLDLIIDSYVMKDVSVDHYVSKDVVGLIFGMAQISDVSRVEFHAVRAQVPDFPLIFQGADGKASHQTLTYHSDSFPPTGRWRIFCARLPDKTPLKMILATSAKVSILHVHGSYELPQSEGSKVVQVNAMVAVRNVE